jgi:hypothetical protein
LGLSINHPKNAEEKRNKSRPHSMHFVKLGNKVSKFIAFLGNFSRY